MAVSFLQYAMRLAGGRPISEGMAAELDFVRSWVLRLRFFTSSAYLAKSEFSKIANNPEFIAALRESG
jgi:hypothetical protein